MRARRKLTDADQIWNRACFREGIDLRDGDRALGAVLLLNGYIMNGGVGHAFDLDPGEFAEAIAGYEYLGLRDLVAIIRQYAAEEESQCNDRYYALEGRGGHLVRAAFDEMFLDHPERFAPVAMG